jgi:hypothetical protein
LVSLGVALLTQNSEEGSNKVYGTLEVSLSLYVLLPNTILFVTGRLLFNEKAVKEGGRLEIKGWTKW